MLWSFSRSQGTTAESEQFGDGQAWVSNRFGTLKVMGLGGCGRRRVRLLNLLCGETHTQGMYLDRWTKHEIGNKKRKSTINRTGRRSAQPERRRNKQSIRHTTRARSRTGELNVET